MNMDRKHASKTPAGGMTKKTDRLPVSNPDEPALPDIDAALAAIDAALAPKPAAETAPKPCRGCGREECPGAALDWQI